MANGNKRDLILDAMQELMNDDSCTTISVSDIARRAGIGKGSIYYYFPSKNDIMEAVIERSYSLAIEKCMTLTTTPDMDALKKMEIIFHTCTEASTELKRQEARGSFMEIQQSALTHQKFLRFLIRSLKPILSDVIHQGMTEGSIHSPYPEETAEIILIVLTVKLDNHIFPSTQDEIRSLLRVFSWMQAKSMDIDMEHLDFLNI